MRRESSGSIRTSAAHKWRQLSVLLTEGRAASQSCGNRNNFSAPSCSGARPRASACIVRSPLDIESDVASLFANNRRRLDLDSAAGAPLDNCQVWDDVPLHMVQGFEAKWGIQQGVRCEPTARFNCHGMTFASRRTAIDDPSVVAQLLKEDGYVKLNNISDVLPGDVVVYYHGADAAHSGIVVAPPDPALGIALTMKVYSKWGPYRELIHGLYNCPYAEGADIVFYRIRDASPEPASPGTTA